MRRRRSTTSARAVRGQPRTAFVCFLRRQPPAMKEEAAPGASRALTSRGGEARALLCSLANELFFNCDGSSIPQDKATQPVDSSFNAHSRPKFIAIPVQKYIYINCHHCRPLAGRQLRTPARPWRSGWSNNRGCRHLVIRTSTAESASRKLSDMRIALCLQTVSSLRREWVERMLQVEWECFWKQQGTVFIHAAGCCFVAAVPCADRARCCWLGRRS